MGHAEIIPLDDVRATHHQRRLRQKLHDCFEQWLNTLESHLDDQPMTLPDLTAVMGQLRQALMGGLTETVIDHTHAAAIEQTQAACPSCEGSLSAHRQAHRTLETLEFIPI